MYTKNVRRRASDSLDVKLRRWAMIQYASHIWKRPELKNYLIDESYISLRRIMPSLREEVDRLELPLCLKDDLKFAIGSMGDTIRDWLFSLMPNYFETVGIDLFNCIDHISWNYPGCIDSTKTIESLYKSKILPINRFTWLRLCHYCAEDAIHHFWKEISTIEAHNELFKCIVSMGLEDGDLITYYWTRRMTNTLDNFAEIVVEFDDSETIDEFMFRQAHEENIQTIVYFWNRLNDQQRKTMLKKMASTAIYNWFDGNLTTNMYFAMFMIKLYRKNGFKKVISIMLRSVDVLDEFLIWPHRDFFTALKAVRCDVKNGIWEYICVNLFNLMHRERLYVGHDAKSRVWLYHFWDNRNIYGLNAEQIEECIAALLDYQDTESLKYILSRELDLRTKEVIIEGICYPGRMEEYGLAKKLFKAFPDFVDGNELLQKKLMQNNIIIDNLWDANKESSEMIVHFRREVLLMFKEYLLNF